MNEDLDRELRDLGPLMVEQAQLEQEGPDPAFAAQLRARLVAQAAERAAVPRGRTLRLPRLTWQWGGLGGAIAVAVVVALILLRSGENTRSPISPGGTKVARFIPPTPSKVDLTKSYPLPIGMGGGGGPISPTRSRISEPSGIPYPGKLALNGKTLPTTPTALSAYRLQRAAYIAGRVKRIAAALAVRGPVEHMRDYELTEPPVPNVLPPISSWLVVRHGPTAAMRSVAVSTLTGALIYHDLSLDVPSTAARKAPTATEALAATRAWLTHAGWPAASRPWRRSNSLSTPDATVITFGWPGISSSDGFSASARVRHGGLVDEALLLPPLQAVTTVKPGSIALAWKQVRAGKAPIGVEESGVAGPNAPAGQGRLRDVTVEQVVTFTKGGRIYLVPAYRFSGTVTLQGVPGSKTWFALVPAT